MTNYPGILPPVSKQYHWLVTGAGGFIGSHLTEALLSLGQKVTGIDNFSTGYRKNIDMAITASGHPGNFAFTEGSIESPEICREITNGVDYVLHHAAFVSVPASMNDPAKCFADNASGFVNILEAARINGVRKVVYATSSAVYGDDETMPKVEQSTGRALSPYALTKYINEMCAEFWTRVYGLECTGLRYFNVFGVRQDPNGAYAAVIPRWIDAVKSGRVPVIYGDGEQSRDFCAVQNVVKANILAAMSSESAGRVFNIGCGVETTLNELLRMIYAVFAPGHEVKAEYQSPREGDIVRSSASIDYAREVLGYEPAVYLRDGLEAMR
ncbi:MAG: NAD-dependent epimerase/dehydratase family protein [Synergistaceae bacterium]|nr:NAD-dependent epimerase/dehydratase family protein [Synergistaceae bacterium]MBQ7168310.1 NAD-dependent epimerase/dehydratase family protein [Synergistaceae bacterium]